jgi:uncharacterized protein YbbC (DUF1343 family)
LTKLTIRGYRNKIKQLTVAILLAGSFSACGQTEQVKLVDYSYINPGAADFVAYLDLIKGKKIALVAHPASVVGNSHLVDTLLAQGIQLSKIFSPEHGFRGNAEAGEKVDNQIDPKTALPIISLYGNHKKPTPEDLKDIDVVLLDLQGVEVRFYTYISTLTYVMEACAEKGIPLIVLDRPNPNGFYIDGPVLKPAFSSFVGMHPVPVVYGMTIGEYAMMVNGEKWLSEGITCDLKVIPVKNYSHNLIVKLPTKPSPNLPNWESVYLYPSLCFFEGTIMSIGRGTDYPFQIYGHPDFTIGSFVFTPESMPGKSLHPKCEGEICYGQNLTGYAENYQRNENRLNLSWLINAYHLLSPKFDFFTDYFDKLAGNDELRKQIESGLTEEEIRLLWQEDLRAFKKLREKYLIYD